MWSTHSQHRVVLYPFKSSLTKFINKESYDVIVKFFWESFRWMYLMEVPKFVGSFILSFGNLGIKWLQCFFSLVKGWHTDWQDCRHLGWQLCHALMKTESEQCLSCPIIIIIFKVFKTWANPGFFSFIFIFSYQFSCQQDLNSDRQIRRTRRWPLDHHHSPVIF